MRTAFIVVKHDGLVGRFMVGQWDEDEIARRYPEDLAYNLLFLGACGWGSPERWTHTLTDYALVMEIGSLPYHGSIFALGGSPGYDLAKRDMPQRPMWLAFLDWLYANLFSDGRGPGRLTLEELPPILDLGDAATKDANGKEARMA